MHWQGLLHNLLFKLVTNFKLFTYALKYIIYILYDPNTSPIFNWKDRFYYLKFVPLEKPMALSHRLVSFDVYNRWETIRNETVMMFLLTFRFTSDWSCISGVLVTPTIIPLILLLRIYKYGFLWITKTYCGNLYDYKMWQNVMLSNWLGNIMFHPLIY